MDESDGKCCFYVMTQSQKFSELRGNERESAQLSRSFPFSGDNRRQRDIVAECLMHFAILQ